MSNPMVPVSIQILDQDYRVSCPADQQESLAASAEYLDDKMRELKKSGKIIGVERMAVITALNIAHELIQCRDKSVTNADEIVTKIEDLEQKVQGALKRDQEATDESTESGSESKLD